jgi:hypothetical protein
MIMTPHGEERGAAARLEPRGPARVNKILTSRSSGGFRQYIVRVYGGFAVFCVANASGKQAPKKIVRDYQP